jgi:transketolase
MSFEVAVHAKAIQLDHLCLDMCAAAGSGHPTTALSLGHIVTVLLYHTMRWLPEHPKYPTSDRLVLSEGHAVPIVYAALADLGAVVGPENSRRPLRIDDLKNLRDNDSVLDGHPNPMVGVPFFDAATGSLGQGLSIAAGLGLAARHDDLDRRIYCIIGDGESREGQIAEAVDLMVDQKLVNVLPIFNCNGYGQADKVSAQQSASRLQAKLEAAGFRVLSIDGHDPAAIRDALDEFMTGAESGGETPMALVARTVKGWGAPSLQGGGWHGKPAAGDRLQQAREELNATRVSLTSALAGDELRIYPPREHKPVEPTRDEPLSMNDAMRKYDMELILRAGKFAPRKAYGLALRALGHAYDDVFALDGDVRNSTFAEWFANDRDLAPRYVECKIAEQNMFSVAAGLAAARKIPFCSTFAKFVTRGYDQIEMAINSGANIKIIGSHAGITPASDGPSQMALPDIAWFRSLSTVRDHHGQPACYILQPADAYAAYALTLAMADHPGACYMRAIRPDVEFIYSEDDEFRLGKFQVLTEGRDLLIVTAGFMVHECNKTLDALDKAGIDATLVDLYSIPFDTEALLDLANANGGHILTVEDNYGGSLGAAVADAVTESGDAFTIEQMYVRRIPKSARTEEDILRQCDLHHSDITRKAASMLGVVTV